MIKTFISMVQVLGLYPGQAAAVLLRHRAVPRIPPEGVRRGEPRLRPQGRAIQGGRS